MTDIQILIAALGALLFTTSLIVVKRRSGKNKELSGKIEEPTLSLSKSTEEVVKETVPEKPTVPVETATKPVSLDKALSNTRSGMMGRIKGLFTKSGSLAPDEFDELEEILYTSDLGPSTVQRLMEGINERLTGKEKSDFDSVQGALKDEMLEIFSSVSQDPLKEESTEDSSPLVLMIVGVNGAGKTTTIGKLANQFASEEKKVLVAAGDTFRAAAEGQLKVWSDRANVDIFAPEGVKDPSAVAFDACKVAKSKDYDVLIVDTAGRLHTQKNLMEELKKMKRVVEKNFSSAPDEVLLVLDANSGQNALIQAKNFHESLGVTGVVLTKLDGSAKGGVAVGVACELSLPVKLIGVGEGIGDLRKFSANEFVDSII